MRVRTDGNNLTAAVLKHFYHIITGNQPAEPVFQAGGIDFDPLSVSDKNPENLFDLPTLGRGKGSLKDTEEKPDELLYV